MQNAEANAALYTDRTSKAADTSNFPQIAVPDLYQSIPDLTKMAAALPPPAFLPDAASLLPSDSGNNAPLNSQDFARAIERNQLPQEIKVGNIPGPGSGGGGDNGFGQAPEWARNFDRKDLPQDIKVGNVPGPGSRAPGGDAIPNSNSATDSGAAEGDRQAGNDSKRTEQQRAENARQAADILNGRGDLGNEYQRRQIKEMYRKALEEGGQAAADKLTQAINKELERRGSNVRVSSNMDFGTPNQPGDGVRLRVMKGSQQVDEARISRPSIWDRRGALDSF